MTEENGYPAKVSCIDKGTNIGGLPDHIHHLILSLGTVRDAVRVAALSTEWRYHYRSLTHLKFTDRDVPALEPPTADLLFKSRAERDSVVRERTSKFIDPVNKFLLSKGAAAVTRRVESLAVSFWFLKEDARHLDEWIRFAIASGAKELDIETWDWGDTKYEFPLGLLAGERGHALARLRLHSCIFPSRSYTGGGSVSFLKRLVLEFATVTEQGLHALLSECTALEWLQILECEGLSNLKISHIFSSKLKFLEVRASDMQKITISAPNLETLEYSGSMVEFVIEDAPKLCRARIFFTPFMPHGTYLTGLANDLPQLKTLLLQFDGNIKCDRPAWEGFSSSYPRSFINLKHLVVITRLEYDDQLLWLGLLLDAAPYIESFHLSLWNSAPRAEEEDYVDDDREPVRPIERVHNHLREVMVCGFNGFVSEMELLIYILHNAVALESMTIDPVGMHYAAALQWRRVNVGPNNKKRVDRAPLARQNGKKLLSVAPPRVKMAIL